MISALIVVIAALLLSGCSGLQKAYEPPRVTLSNMAIKEAKALVDEAPKAVREAVSKDEAETAKVKLEEAGAIVDIK